MTFAVRFTQAAERDIVAVIDWYASQSTTAAEKWLSGLGHATRSLERLPERCGLAPDHAFFRRAVREHVFGSRSGRYRLLFEIRGDTVIVLRVRHAAQSPLQDIDDE